MEHKTHTAHDTCDTFMTHTWRIHDMHVALHNMHIALIWHAHGTHMTQHDILHNTEHNGTHDSMTCIWHNDTRMTRAWCTHDTHGMHRAHT